MPDRKRVLELALKGLEVDRAKLDEEIADIKRELGQRPSVANLAAPPASAAKAVAPPKRRKMSAAARKKISEAMKRRYAAMRAASKK